MSCARPIGVQFQFLWRGYNERWICYPSETNYLRQLFLGMIPTLASMRIGLRPILTVKAVSRETGLRSKQGFTTIQICLVLPESTWSYRRGGVPKVGEKSRFL